MLILGLNTFHADASAVLVKDGVLVAAIAEERLNRVKHFAGFPGLAARECLRMAGADLEDVDHLALARDSKANLLSKLGFAAMNVSRITKLARQRLENRAQVAGAPELLAQAFGKPASALRAEVHAVEHHLAHLASAFLVSPFEKAALQSIDGFGDFASSMSGVGEGSRIKIFDRTLFPHSLGVLYTAACQFIGYDKYGDEGKVMGLAPYGKDRYREEFDQIVRLEPGGKFKLDLDWFIHHSEGVDYSFDEHGHPSVAPLYSSKFTDVFGKPRARGAELTERDKDIARSLQECLERAYFHLLLDLHERTRVDTLCLAGGVALNSVANGKILDRTPFRRIYVQPAASDDGTAVGAAYWVWNAVLKQPRTFVMESALTGPSFDDEACRQSLAAAGLRPALLSQEDLCRRVAQEVAAGKVVGWFQGRMEWGPRALGARSIVAHPGHPQMKDILNSRIKHREWFRPFAPSVLEEKVGQVFEHDHPDPFMLMVYKIRPEWRAKLCAVNHVDDTGRLQTVSEKVNPVYHRLIREFEKITGTPVILNTSFNENEPIVCRPEQAIDCFLRTRMDGLALGNYYVSKEEAGPAPASRD
jgi:carbamoyltransferase